MLNAPETCPWKCGGSQAGGGGGVVQDTTNTGAPRVGLWGELHSKESERILGLSIWHYKFQECAVQLPTINKEPLASVSGSYIVVRYIIQARSVVGHIPLE